MSIAIAVLMGILPILWLKKLPTHHYELLSAPIIIFYIYKFTSPLVGEVGRRPGEGYKIILKKTMVVLLVLIFSFTWSCIYCKKILSWQLDKQLEDKLITVVGEVVSLINTKNKSVNFVFKTKSINATPVKTKLKLIGYRGLNKIHPGEKWRFSVKLRRPHAPRNYGSIDKEKWYFSHGIRAIGKIINTTNNYKIKYAGFSFLSIRDSVNRNLDSLIQSINHFGIIHALITGDQTKLTQAEINVFRNTGTSHLMAISGLHVGLITGLVFALSRFIFCFFPFLYLTIPLQRLSAMLAMSSAVLYSGLAGFSYSTQRAMIMVICTLMRYWLPWKASFVDTVSVALIIVLLLSPIAVLDVGFWLSFSAVLVLGYAIVYQKDKNNLWWKWGRAQWACFVGLLPISTWYFNQISLYGLFANLIAIPWVSLVTVPLALLGVVFLPMPALSEVVLKVDLKLFDYLYNLLSLFGNVPFGVLQLTMSSPIVFMLSILGAVVILSPSRWAIKSLGSLLFIPLFLPKPSGLKHGEAKITVLDVGQGLASVVQTAHHVMIYDTGPRYGKKMDAGKLNVLPFLNYAQINKIDMMMVSHGDSDHMGGAHSIIENIPTKQILTSAPDKLKMFHPRNCQRGQHWEWDGVVFEVIFPEPNSPYKANASSCVLKVSASHASALLTGDIEKKNEKHLISMIGHNLHSNVLIVPHHGSKTSSSSAFLRLVNPSVGVFSYGYRNRYHHPHPLITQRYTELGIERVNTVEGGEIDVLLSDQILVREFRKQHRHIWSH